MVLIHLLLFRVRHDLCRLQAPRRRSNFTIGEPVPESRITYKPEARFRPPEHGSLARVDIQARGAVAFLLFPLPKPSVEAEQRQQMVPRALLSSRLLISCPPVSAHLLRTRSSGRASTDV